jgi:hypothetical protein
LDEKEPDFKDKLKKAVLMAHSEDLRQEVDELFPTGLENTSILGRNTENPQARPLIERE